MLKLMAFWNLKTLFAITVLLFTFTAFAFKDNACDDLDDEPCLWKITCFKDPDEPNKIIPSDCAKNYKEPETPAPPPPKKVETLEAPAPRDKTPLEKLYYIPETSS